MTTQISGTTGVSGVQDGVIVTADLADLAVTPEKMSQKMTLMATVTASGTAIDFTSIPSWVKRITVMFNGVSTNGSSPKQIQLVSGSIKASGYNGAATGASTAVVTINASTGLLVENATAAVEASYGIMTITHMGGNTWVSTCTRGQTGAAATAYAGCGVTLSGTLDRLRLTTVNGTDTFDAGTVNVLYEG